MLGTARGERTMRRRVEGDSADHVRSTLLDVFAQIEHRPAQLSHVERFRRRDPRWSPAGTRPLRNKMRPTYTGLNPASTR